MDPKEFVGRHWEMAILRRELETAVGGRLCVVVLAGEPGIGKTRLMAQLVEHADSNGVRVLQGGASDAEGMPPYLPFLEALGSYIQTTDGSILQRQCGDSGAILATILPELTVRLGGAIIPYALPPEQARLRLFEAIGLLLRAIAEASGLLLALDDLHWADPSTLDLLVHLARRQATARILVIAGFRTGEANAHAALQRALVELTRQRVLTRLSLGPLTRTELMELISASIPGDTHESVCDSLHAQSGGNPFFAEELMRVWLESAILVQGSGRWQLAAEGHRVLPESIVSAVGERLRRLPPATQELLRLAAIVGRSFEIEFLVEVCRRPVEQVEDELAPAVTAGLIVHEESACQFTHDTVREAAGAGMGSSRRRRVHAAIGEALEGQADSGAPPRLAELAFHFCRAGNAEKGVGYAMRAADEAELSFAFAEAVLLYREALRLLGENDVSGEGSDVDVRGEIMLRCGHAALGAGREREAHELFQQAYGRYQRRGNALMAGRAARGLALAHWRQGDLESASMALEAAVAHLAVRHDADLARAMVDMASLRNWMGRQPEGLEAARRALELATQLGDGHLEAAAYRVAGQLTAWGNDFEDGNRQLERALALAVENDDPAEAAEVCGILANTYFATFNTAGSHRVTLMRMEFARRSQQPHEMRHVHGWLAELCVQRGEWTEAEMYLTQAQAVVDQLEDDEPRAALSRVRGRMAQYRDQLEDAARWYAEALALVESKGPQHLSWYLGTLACVELSLGHRTRAEELMLRLEEALGHIPAGAFPAAPGLTDAVEWALQAGDVRRAHAHAERLRAFQGRMFLSAVDLTLARYERAIGNHAAATTYLQRVEREARRAGLRMQLLPILIEKAKSAGAREPSVATAALEEAQALRDTLGLTERAWQIATELGQVRTVSVPAGLSPRELEVLRLVAAGQSNREIARSLVLSEKTVEHHLTSIFNKTGTSNRAGATAFAFRHGLD